MALVEWLLKENLPENMLHSDKRKNGAAFVFRQAEKQFSLPIHIWETLHSARKLRNDHVHEKPTSRSETYDPASIRYTNSSTANVFDEAALAAFELFCTINRSRASDVKAADSSE